MANHESASRVLIAGDVYPTEAEAQALLAATGQERPPELFLFTLDAAIAAGPTRPDQTCLGFVAEYLDALKLGQQTVAVAASNHLNDFGQAGVEQTLAELAARDIHQVGAGLTKGEAHRPLVLDLEKGRLAILAWAETQPRVGAVAATAGSPGVADFDIDRAVAEVENVAKEADWVWTVLHWGEEYVRFPDPQQRRDARRLADAGADLVVAVHTHVPLGFERRGDSSIFYGLGNFLFPGFREARGYDYHFHRMARRGLVLEAELGSGGWQWQTRGLRHNRRGQPRAAAPRCPDYGYDLAPTLAAYELQFLGLRRRERALHTVQRLVAMSASERRFRLRRMLGQDRS